MSYRLTMSVNPTPFRVNRSSQRDVVSTRKRKPSVGSENGPPNVFQPTKHQGRSAEFGQSAFPTSRTELTDEPTMANGHLSASDEQGVSMSARTLHRWDIRGVAQVPFKPDLYVVEDRKLEGGKDVVLDALCEQNRGIVGVFGEG